MLKGLLSPVTKRHVERKVLPTDPRHLFGIIQDVDSYSQFLPFCSESRILQRHDNGASLQQRHNGGQQKAPSSSSFDALLTVGLLPRDGGGLLGSAAAATPLWSFSSTAAAASWLQTSYVSRVCVDPEEMVVETRSLADSGSHEQGQNLPFDSISSRWKLDRVDGILSRDDSTASRLSPRCSVHFEVEITASDPLIVTVLDRVLETVASRQVEAFEQRCQQVPPMV